MCVWNDVDVCVDDGVMMGDDDGVIGCCVG